MSYTLSWTINQPNEFDLNWAAALEYVSFQKGPMSSTGLAQLTGILPSIYTTPDHPDLQFFFGGYQASCAATGEIGALMDDGRRSISISPTNIQPRSRGIIAFHQWCRHFSSIIRIYANTSTDATLTVSKVQTKGRYVNLNATIKMQSIFLVSALTVVIQRRLIPRIS